MSDEDRIREALLILEERPRPLPTQAADAIFSRMVEELEREAAPSGIRFPTRRGTRRLNWMRTRPAIAFGLALALLVGAAVVLFIPRGPSALAVLQEARTRFKDLPPYHAKTFVTADEDRSSSDFDVTWETEDWYESRTRFRTVVLSSNYSSIGIPGTFRVSDGTLLGDYRADTNIFSVTPLDELEGPQDPAGFFNPSLQWWGSGRGDAKPSDQFFEENCTAHPGEFIGRKATRLLCPAEPREIDLWVDDETGMLLRIEVFDVIREIKSIEFHPEFPAGIFELKGPEGAKKRWGGKGTPLPEYAVSIGSEVSARFQVASGDIGGFQVMEVSATGIWATITRGGNGAPYSDELVRIDPRTGKVLASVKPATPTFINDARIVGGHLWISFSNNSERGTMNSGWLQRLDLKTNKLIAPRIDISPAPGRLALVDGFLWTPGGKSRHVVQGRGEVDYPSVAKVDLSTFEVTTMELDGGAGSSVVFHSGHVWVRVERLNQSGNDTEYLIAKIDPRVMKVVATIDFPNYPAGVPLVAGDKYFHTVSVDRSNKFFVVQIDPATGKTASAPGAPDGGVVAFGGGYLWQISPLENGIVKYDPVTLKIAGRIATGQTPFGIGVGLGSVWVTHRDGSLARIDIE